MIILANHESTCNDNFLVKKEKVCNLAIRAHEGTGTLNNCKRALDCCRFENAQTPYRSFPLRLARQSDRNRMLPAWAPVRSCNRSVLLLFDPLPLQFALAPQALLAGAVIRLAPDVVRRRQVVLLHVAAPGVAGVVTAANVKAGKGL